MDSTEKQYMNTHSENPENAIKEEIKAFWNARGRVYDLYRPWSDEVRKVWKDELLGIIGSKKQEILDVGTGTGFLAINLAELGHYVSGLDMSEEMMAEAKARAHKYHLNIRFLQDDAENPHLEDNSFDCVICRHLLWTLPNPEKALDEWIRIVRPGGKIVIIDVIPSSDHRYIRCLNTWALTLLRLGKIRSRDVLKMKYSDTVNSYLRNDRRFSILKAHESMEEAGLKEVGIKDLIAVTVINRKESPWYLKYAFDFTTRASWGIVNKTPVVPRLESQAKQMKLRFSCKTKDVS